MTSRNLFWDKFRSGMRENRKRRILVWAVAWMMQIMCYVCITLIYLSRIRSNFEEYPQNAEIFVRELCNAARDAIGFSEWQFFAMLVLAALIGLQGFGYLFDKRKVDMYHSVPVSKKSRFVTIYAGGILIYVIPTLVAVLLSCLIAGAYQAMSAFILAQIAVKFVYNLLLFLILYHTMILCVMLTGHGFFAGCGYMVLLFYEIIVRTMAEGITSQFFHSADYFYAKDYHSLSIISDYSQQYGALKRVKSIEEMLHMIAPMCLKWIVLAVVLLVLAYVCYRSRKEEMMGRAMAFRVTEPFIKVLLAVPLAYCIGGIVYDTSGDNRKLMFMAILIAAILIGLIIEIFYRFDVKSVLCHPVSTVVGAALAVLLFVGLQKDVFGYDSYVPKADSVESVAIVGVYSYMDYWDENCEHIYSGQYIGENMYVTDVEPVIALAEKAVEQKGYDKLEDGCYESFSVLYRLKSGRKVARRYFVDMSDAENMRNLDRITGSEAFRKGYFQMIQDENCVQHVKHAYYENGAVSIAIPIAELGRIREAWIADMEDWKLSFARENYPVGKVCVTIGSYITADMFIYDSFERTIACLEELSVFYDNTLSPEDIQTIRVTRYIETDEADDTGTAAEDIYEYAETEYMTDNMMTEVFEDTEKIAEIIKDIYPDNLNVNLFDENKIDGEYEIEIAFKHDTTYPYDRNRLSFWYRFPKGRIPKPVAEVMAVEK